MAKHSKVRPGVFPGQPIRFPVEEKGRHVMATRGVWLNKYAIDERALGHDGIEEIKL